MARNRIGAINQALQTLAVAATFRSGLSVAAVVLCDTEPADEADPSRRSNGSELARRVSVPAFTQLGFHATRFQPAVDWLSLCQ